MFVTHLPVFIILITFTNQQCSEIMDPYQNHLASNTPYRFIANLDDHKIEYEGNETTVLILNHFIFLYRMYPSKSMDDCQAWYQESKHFIY